VCTQSVEFNVTCTYTSKRLSVILRSGLAAVYVVGDRLCGLVVRVLGYRSGGPASIPGTIRIKKVMGLERGPLSLVSTNEELLDTKV
jgi:hypothetical protein